MRRHIDRISVHVVLWKIVPSNDIVEFMELHIIVTEEQGGFNGLTFARILPAGSLAILLEPAWRADVIIADRL